MRAEITTLVKHLYQPSHHVTLAVSYPFFYPFSIPPVRPINLLTRLLQFRRSYLALASRTRLYLGLGIIAWSGFGLIATNMAEKKFGLEPSEEEKQKLARAVPKVRAMERD